MEWGKTRRPADQQTFQTALLQGAHVHTRDQLLYQRRIHGAWQQRGNVSGRRGNTQSRGIDERESLEHSCGQACGEAIAASDRVDPLDFGRDKVPNPVGVDHERALAS